MGLEHFQRGPQKVEHSRTVFAGEVPRNLMQFVYQSFDILLVFGRIGFSCLEGPCLVVDLGSGKLEETLKKS